MTFVKIFDILSKGLILLSIFLIIIVTKENIMADKTSIKSTAVTIKAYEIASAIVNKRKSEGLSSSITAVISEAVVEKFGKEICQAAQTQA